MEIKYYTILTSPNYNNPSLLVKDWNKENYPFGFDGVNHDGTECIWAQGQEVYIKKDVDEAIAELKAKLESVQASMYADVIDANMENRRLKRALWMERAERAKEKQQLFHFSLGYEKLCIDGFYDPYSGRRELSPKQWIKTFNKVEVKLLKKAEEYK